YRREDTERRGSADARGMLDGARTCVGRAGVAGDGGSNPLVFLPGGRRGGRDCGGFENGPGPGGGGARGSESCRTRKEGGGFVGGGRGGRGTGAPVCDCVRGAGGRRTGLPAFCRACGGFGPVCGRSGGGAAFGGRGLGL